MLKRYQICILISCHGALFSALVSYSCLGTELTSDFKIRHIMRFIFVSHGSDLCTDMHKESAGRFSVSPMDFVNGFIFGCLLHTVTRACTVCIVFCSDNRLVAENHVGM